MKPGATLLTDGHASYPGLAGYRHDPRVVGKMAGHVVLPWIHRAFSLMKRWGLGMYHGLRRTHIDTYLNEFVFRYNRRFYRHVSFEPFSGWEPIINPRATGTSPSRTIHARASKQKGERHDAEKQRPECDRMARRHPYTPIRINTSTKGIHYI